MRASMDHQVLNEGIRLNILGRNNKTSLEISRSSETGAIFALRTR